MDPSSLSQVEIKEEDLSEFKNQVKNWLQIDEEISKYQMKIKELKKAKKSILEPNITSFMVTYNIADLNTEQGKIRCNEKNTKKPLNKKNIEENLAQVITDEGQINQAMQLIMNNRENICFKKKKKKIT